MHYLYQSQTAACTQTVIADSPYRFISVSADIFSNENIQLYIRLIVLKSPGTGLWKWFFESAYHASVDRTPTLLFAGLFCLVRDKRTAIICFAW